MEKKGVILTLIFLFVFTFTSLNVDGATSQPVNVSISIVAGDPIITLISPADSFSTTDTAISFTYNVSHSINVSNCSLILDGSVNSVNTNITLDSTENFSVTGLSVSSHTWQVNCTDTSNVEGNSSSRSFTITSSGGGGGGGGGGCIPDCSGKVCGDNGCGGSCGTCILGQTCDNGLCIPACTDQCTPGSNENECVSDDVNRSRSCVLAANGCYDWEEWTANICEFNEMCQTGDCVACVENWVCDDWGACLDGEQTRTCNDINSCGTQLNKPNETQECISGFLIDYSPDDLDLVVALDDLIDFTIDVEDLEDFAEINVEWYLDGVLQEDDFGIGKLSSFYSSNFTGTTLEGVILVDGQSQSVVWEIEVNESAPIECETSWSCQWTDCVEGDTYQYAYGCVDVNSCGVDTGQPYSRECSCYPNFECGEFSQCNARYFLDDAIEGSSFVQGFIERTCVDTTGCELDRTEREICELNVPIVAKEGEFCEEEIVEISDAQTNELLGVVKKDPILEFTELERLDISLLTTSFTGYCDYCFNGVQDVDEEGVDCGGPSCPPCFEVEEFFDWLPIAIYTSWLFTLFVAGAILYLRRTIVFDFGSRVLYSAKFGSAQERKLENKILRFFKGKRKMRVRRVLRKIMKVEKRVPERKGAKLVKLNEKELSKKLLREELKRRKK